MVGIRTSSVRTANLTFEPSPLSCDVLSWDVAGRKIKPAKVVAARRWKECLYRSAIPASITLAFLATRLCDLRRDLPFDTQAFEYYTSTPSRQRTASRFAELIREQNSQIAQVVSGRTDLDRIA